MLARAACRLLSLFCAMLYLVVGVPQGGGGVGGKHEGGGGGASERKRITDALLTTVARGYPPKQAMHAIRVSAGGCYKAKKDSGPAVDLSKRFSVGR